MRRTVFGAAVVGALMLTGCWASDTDEPLSAGVDEPAPAASPEAAAETAKTGSAVVEEEASDDPCEQVAAILLEELGYQSEATTDDVFFSGGVFDDACTVTYFDELPSPRHTEMILIRGGEAEFPQVLADMEANGVNRPTDWTPDAVGYDNLWHTEGNTHFASPAVLRPGEIEAGSPTAEVFYEAVETVFGSTLIRVTISPNIN